MSPRRILARMTGGFFLGLIGGIIVGAICATAFCLGPNYRLSRQSYADTGEDLIVASIFQHLNIERPTYLDIGAWDPIQGSNTYLFCRAGSHGVLVEPNPVLCDKLRRVRPGDVVLNTGIGLERRTEADYYMFEDSSAMNTFSKEQAEGLPKIYGDRYSKPKVVKTHLVPINDVIAEHFKNGPPDFLSVDVEGLDFGILKSLDFDRHGPRVICVETDSTVTEQSRPIFDLMEKQGYHLWGRTPHNAIFVGKPRAAANSLKVAG
jgi:FkbM family methyltransferase